MLRDTILRKTLFSVFFLLCWTVSHLLYPATLAAEEDAKKLARAGDRIITSEDLQDMIEGSKGRRFKTKASKLHLLRELVRVEVFSQEARALGLDKDQALKKAIKRIVNFFLAKEHVKRYVRGVVTVSEEEVRAYFRKNPDQFQTLEKIKVRQIFLETDPGDSPQEISKKKDLAENILRMIRGGKDFSELSSEFSTNPMLHRRGGDLGYVAKGALSPKMGEAVFSLKVGEVSPVVKDDSGFSIFKNEGRRPAGIKPLDEVREEIEKKLRQEREDKRFLELEKSLFAKYNVEIYEEKLQDDPLSEEQPAEDESIVHGDVEDKSSAPDAPHLKEGQPAMPVLPGLPQDPMGEIKRDKSGSAPSVQ
ncbi:MAG TPA: hypothetical protein ENI07_09540 [Desulfobacterales bacterium]|nr:hypothetical protein [Desulfobacterales bacterium]